MLCRDGNPTCVHRTSACTTSLRGAHEGGSKQDAIIRHVKYARLCRSFEYMYKGTLFLLRCVHCVIVHVDKIAAFKGIQALVDLLLATVVHQRRRRPSAVSFCC